MLRQSLLLGVAGMAFAGASWAQQRGQSRDDLLDALTRHIQICGETSVEGDAVTSPACKVAGCTPISANRLTVACCMRTSGNDGSES